MRAISGSTLVLLSAMRFKPLTTQDATDVIESKGMKVSRGRITTSLKVLCKNGLAERQNAGFKGLGKAKAFKTIITEDGEKFINDLLASPIEPSTAALIERLQIVDLKHDKSALLSAISNIEISLPREINESIKKQTTLTDTIQIIEHIKELDLKKLEEVCITIRALLDKE